MQTATKENVEGVSSGRSAEVVGHGLMNSLGNTWLKNPIASMNRSNQPDLLETMPITDKQKIFDSFASFVLSPKNMYHGI